MEARLQRTVSSRLSPRRILWDGVAVRSEAAGVVCRAEKSEKFCGSCRRLTSPQCPEHVRIIHQFEYSAFVFVDQVVALRVHCGRNMFGSSISLEQCLFSACLVRSCSNFSRLLSVPICAERACGFLSRVYTDLPQLRELRFLFIVGHSRLVGRLPDA